MARSDRHTVHLCVFDGYADWEPAHAIAGIQEPRFQREPGRFQVCAVAERGRPVVSMGGLTVQPDEWLAHVDPAASAMLVLPGGHGWETHPGGPPSVHGAAVDKAREFLAAGTPVAAICGATAGLARAGLLDARPHTSNARSDLKGLPGYDGLPHDVDAPVVRSQGLITAGGMNALVFAREVFAELGLYADDALHAWYDLHLSGRSERFADWAQAAARDAAARGVQPAG